MFLKMYIVVYPKVYFSNIKFVEIFLGFQFF